MQPFRYAKPTRVKDAIHLVMSEENAMYLAGGTTLVNQLRSGFRRATQLVDITGLPLTGIEASSSGLRIGALERGTARNEQVREEYPVLSEALLSGASPQIRNMATPGGNLMQGLRTPFFHEAGLQEGQMSGASSGADLGLGYRMGPIFGDGNATYGSDLGVALAALDASVVIQGMSGEKSVPVAEFYLEPTANDDAVTALARGDLITGIEIPTSPRIHSTYLKARDRASFAYLLVSAAVALELEGSVVRSARIVLGGVATRPYRATAAEEALVGQTLSNDVIANAASLTTQDATPKSEAAYKVDLVQRVVTRALQTVGGIS
jgi:xanthine dehydrogenase YagS FAD-binding subunit